MPSLAEKPYYNVERRGPDTESWYQVMLAPFKTLDECWEYIEKYRHCYPLEHQNYRITFER